MKQRKLQTVLIGVLLISAIVAMGAMFSTALSSGSGGTTRFGGLVAAGDVCTIVKEDGVPVDCTGTCTDDAKSCTLNSHFCECK